MPQVNVEILRTDALNLKYGVIVMYQLKNIGFRVAAHRGGVEIAGVLPPMPRAGVEAVQEVLRRAILHHEHLKTFEVGTQQIALPETDFGPVAPPPPRIFAPFGAGG